MQAGKLRHRLLIQYPERFQNAIGEWEDNWTDLETVWGSVEPLGGRTYFEARQANSDVDGKITIRYRHLEPTWRFVWNDWEGTNKIFRIVSIIQPQHRGKETQILYKEALD